jgi:hypothetical protein
MNTEICAVFDNRELARAIARKGHGTLYIDEREDTHKLPFAALVCIDTDNLQGLIEQADVGVFLVHRRIIKQHIPDNSVEQNASLSLHTLVAHPALGHRKSDDYWRDNHAPLALRVHVAMIYYHQLSILHCFKGPAWDGFALLGFASLDDLQNNYFSSQTGKAEIFRDIEAFADTRNSPGRRLVAKTWRY